MKCERYRENHCLLYTNPNELLFVKTFSDILTSKNSMFKKVDIWHVVI